MEPQSSVLLNEQRVVPLNADTVVELLTLSKEAYLEIPPDSQFKGLNRPLTDQEKRFLAIFSACATFLNQKGCLKPNTKVRIELEQVGIISDDDLLKAGPKDEP